MNVPQYLSDEVLLSAFPAASWAEVEATALQRRFDRKFVLRNEQLEQVLAQVKGRYRVLPTAGRPLATYSTVYFDTPDMFMFMQHARGKRPRFKVRIRHYPDRQVSYLEVKEKTNRGETRKERKQVAFGEEIIPASHHNFIRKHTQLDPAALRPLLSTNFKRLTLLDPVLGERVTSDIFLSFVMGSVSKDLSRLVITEIKQANALSRTPFTEALHDVSARARSFSKYSLGVAFLGLATRVNAFRPAVRMIERLVHA